MVTDGMVAGRELYEGMRGELDKKAEQEKLSKLVTHDPTLPVIGERKKLPKLKDLRPTSDELLKMTIKQKSDLIAKMKFVERRRSQAFNSTHESLVKKVETGKLNPCAAAEVEKQWAIAKNAPKRDDAKEEERRRIQAEREKIKLKHAKISAEDNYNFNELLKNTYKQFKKANTQFQTQKLMRKIVEQGSLYGVPSTQITDSHLEEHEETEIARPVNFLREGEIENLYEHFREEIERMKEEDQHEAEVQRERNKKINILGSEEMSASKGSVKSTAWMKIGKQAEVPVKITTFDDAKTDTRMSRAKSVPRTAKSLPSALTEDEKKLLRERVK